MAMVSVLVSFGRAVRTWLWKLHQTALQRFLKYFFTQNRLNYTRMMPVNLAEIEMLTENDPLLMEEFEGGNWVVRGGLVGITLNQSSRNKFFLVSSHMARLAEEAFEF